MSRAHPIVAVTGASGAGTTSVQETFKSICADAKFEAIFVEGDSFHRYEREEMRKLIDAWERTAGRTISHFGPEANLFTELEELFNKYGEQGIGREDNICTTKMLRAFTAKKLGLLQNGPI